ncbi:uncharacterized protein LOC113508858 isoform X2 [Trichoplusia ni]|uniref:Uncharacterized protein LOC113508858 isoform X2 n=1 Tax=Trichoplusia ni TaxID=7111 RepID=A0A7E5X520_TRINI|nr:uncharacterized protein LOC113508858 isoform X2 [Trichoplusia ni]
MAREYQKTSRSDAPEIEKVFEFRNRKNPGKYCAVCLRSERVLVDNTQFKKFISVINLEHNWKLFQPPSICYICSRQATKAYRFYCAAKFAASVNQLFLRIMRLDKTAQKDVFHKTHFEKLLRQMTAEDKMTQPSIWELELKGIRQRSSLTKSTTMMVDHQGVKVSDQDNVDIIYLEPDCDPNKFTTTILATPLQVPKGRTRGLPKRYRNKRGEGSATRSETVADEKDEVIEIRPSFRDKIEFVLTDDEDETDVKLETIDLDCEDPKTPSTPESLVEIKDDVESPLPTPSDPKRAPSDPKPTPSDPKPAPNTPNKLPAPKLVPIEKLLRPVKRTEPQFVLQQFILNPAVTTHIIDGHGQLVSDHILLPSLNNNQILPPATQPLLTMLPVPQDQNSLPVLPMSQESTNLQMVPISQNNANLQMLPQENNNMAIFKLTQANNNLQMLPGAQVNTNLSMLPIQQENTNMQIMNFTQSNGNLTMLPQENINMPIIKLSQDNNNLQVLPVSQMNTNFQMLQMTQDNSNLQMLPVAQPNCNMQVLPVSPGNANMQMLPVSQANTSLQMAQFVAANNNLPLMTIPQQANTNLQMLPVSQTNTNLQMISVSQANTNLQMISVTQANTNLKMTPVSQANTNLKMTPVSQPNTKTQMMPVSQEKTNDKIPAKVHNRQQERPNILNLPIPKDINIKILPKTTKRKSIDTQTQNNKRKSNIPENEILPIPIPQEKSSLTIVPIPPIPSNNVKVSPERKDGVDMATQCDGKVLPVKPPQPPNRTIDWEDRIPMDVISFMETTEPANVPMTMTNSSMKVYQRRSPSTRNVN